MRDRVLEAAEFIPPDRLGTTDDCAFSAFADDASTSCDTAFAKIRARGEGTALADQVLGVCFLDDATHRRMSRLSGSRLLPLAGLPGSRGFEDARSGYC